MDSFLKKSSILYGDAKSIIASQYSGSILLIDPSLRESLKGFPQEQVIILPQSGEKIKSVHYLEEISKELLAKGADRKVTLIGVGGGATTDFVGFLGSIFMRGVKTVLVPTSLLAQVDASIGGKNGVDIGEIKNILGTIQEPAAIIIDTNFLNTVSVDELRSGIAEVIKIGFLMDSAFVEWISSNNKKIFSKDKATLDQLVKKAIELKLSIVTNDSYEQGDRRLLNLGHTLGHAIEMGLGLRHGEAVALGIVLEAKVGAKLKLISDQVESMLSDYLSQFGLPVSLDSPIEPFIDLISRDKKREGNKLYLPLVSSIGQSEVFEVSFKEFVDAVRNIN